MVFNFGKTLTGLRFLAKRGLSFLKAGVTSVFWRSFEKVLFHIISSIHASHNIGLHLSHAFWEILVFDIF